MTADNPPPDPGHLTGGDGAWLSGRALARLRAWAAAVDHAMRRDGIGWPPYDSAIRDLLVEGAARYAAVGSPAVPPNSFLPRSAVGSVMVDPVGTLEAATLLGCKARNVRDLCQRGVFETARLRSGGWLVERDEVVSRAMSAGQRARDTTSGEAAA